MVSPGGVKHGKGWFIIGDRDGDRTVDQQMVGLEKVVGEAAGKTVLDVGCAEGLISIALARAGAQCLGLEVVPSHVTMANELKGDLPCEFRVLDLNVADFEALQAADIVLMLAILHKLKEPARVCGALAERARDLVVIRLPPSGPVIVDARSKNVPQDIGAVMAAAGFKLEAVVETTMNEWLGYFRRVVAPKDEPSTPRPDSQTEAQKNYMLINAALDTRESEPTISETKPLADETDQVEAGPKVQEVETTSPSADAVTIPAAGARVVSGQPLFPNSEQARGRRGRGEGKVRGDDKFRGQ